MNQKIQITFIFIKEDSQMSKNRKSGRQKMIVYKQTLNAAKNVNKHGEIKVKHASKNEKKRVLTGCMHHDLKKNGMPKSRVIVHQDGTCTCRTRRSYRSNGNT